MAAEAGNITRSWTIGQQANSDTAQYEDVVLQISFLQQE
jgi:hypothetical protein